MLELSIQKKLHSFTLDVELQMEPGTVLGLFGPSGSGKSMLMKMICGIEKPDSGKIIFDSQTWADTQNRIFVPVHKRNAGYLFQSYALFDQKSALENVILGMSGKHQKNTLSKQEKKELAISLLEKTGLEPFASFKPDKLSGGQKQRLALARMLAQKPVIWLLDEPFSALDSATKAGMIQFLKEQISQANVPVIFCSHDLQEIQTLCDSYIQIEYGKISRMASKPFQKPETGDTT